MRCVAAGRRIGGEAEVSEARFGMRKAVNVRTLFALRKQPVKILINDFVSRLVPG